LYQLSRSNVCTAFFWTLQLRGSNETCTSHSQQKKYRRNIDIIFIKTDLKFSLQFGNYSQKIHSKVENNTLGKIMAMQTDKVKEIK
jgi:PBP1b-binding outer membrane lipoprotein LpoB